MKWSFVLVCFFIGASYAFRDMLSATQKMGESLMNPMQMMFRNVCVADLGCFYTGPPFFHQINRPFALPPTTNPRPKFLLYTPSNRNEQYELKIAQDSLKNSPFDQKLPTKFLIHGFVSPKSVIQPDYNANVFFKDAMLGEGAYNVILVDWSAHNGPPYAQAVANTRVIGATVAKMVLFLTKEAGISAESVHIIGHSLGAHVASYAGERIPNLGRITGLDPAGPYFLNTDPKVRLDPTDAIFVDVLHTDGSEHMFGGLGMKAPMGHIDFYPNGGSRQIGCNYTQSTKTMADKAIDAVTQLFQNGCAHERANMYYLESIKNKNCRFLAVQCTSYEDFQQGRCSPDNSKVAEMGFHLEKIPGLQFPAKFYLRTKGESPFCDGGMF